jgi:membrane-bound metal-dependent hydrolase YbcI (DUF457 family)
MLPPGHIVAGFLVAEGLLAIIEPSLTIQQTNALLVTGALFGFIPDLDFFYAFLKARGFTIPGTKINHRAYLTHRPLFWLALAFIIFIFAQSEFWKLFAILVWLGTWSHFVLDSLKVGVMWLWPFNSKFYAILSPGQKEDNQAKGFFNYWFTHLTFFYPKKFTSTFVLEIIILLLGVITLVIKL